MTIPNNVLSALCSQSPNIMEVMGYAADAWEADKVLIKTHDNCREQGFTMVANGRFVTVCNHRNSEAIRVFAGEGSRHPWDQTDTDLDEPGELKESLERCFGERDAETAAGYVKSLVRSYLCVEVANGL